MLGLFISTGNVLLYAARREFVDQVRKYVGTVEVDYSVNQNFQAVFVK